MKLIIDIDEEIAQGIIDGEGEIPRNIVRSFQATIADAIKNGTPLKDIKEEIEEEKDCAYADFEEYKVNYLGQDWEDVLDSLPQDDFRYGMERALEILYKNVRRVN